MRLIDADALIDELGISDEDIIFEGMLVDAPTIDAVPVVRCKDCKHGRKSQHQDGNNPYWVCLNWDSGTDEDGYCHHGERKDDDKSCDTCKHYDKGWDDAICDGCTTADSRWERKDDE